MVEHLSDFFKRHKIFVSHHLKALFTFFEKKLPILAGIRFLLLAAFFSKAKKRQVMSFNSNCDSINMRLR